MGSLMSFAQRIEAVRQKYKDIMALHQQAGEQPISSELLNAALHEMSNVIKELQTAYEETVQSFACSGSCETLPDRSKTKPKSTAKRFTTP